MELWDLLAVTNGAAFVLGGFGGALAGAQLNATHRAIIDDGERGVFVGLWMATFLTLLLWICYKGS
ncbi:MAG TPA: hypothetical protein VN238_12270 [Solirubrobacteraceae bacterium]|nr:hypothetical protein [Solirubrobacteraceae bacterium]